MMKTESDALLLALANLPQQLQPQLLSQVTEPSNAHDAVITLDTSEQQLEFNVELKTIHRKESLQALIANRRPPHHLLICNVLTPFLASYCADHHINYIDAAGNARINVPGMMLWISGRQLSAPPLSKAPINGKRISIGTMKLIFVLLAYPEVLNTTYRKISALAGISLGMVSKGYSYLKDEGFIRASDKQLRLMEPEILVVEWIRNYRSVLRPKLGGIQLTAPDDWHDVSLQDGEIWGGEVAADQLTHYLKPEQLQLFTPKPLQQRIGDLKLRPDQQGRFWLTPSFWGEELQIDPKTQALLAVAELLASGDSRNSEVATILNEQYLHLKTLPTHWV